MRVRWLWLLLLLLIPVLVMPAAALEGWLYYRDITISNSLNPELTDYQVKIVLDTYSLILGGKMRSDCGDIRFTDSGGNLLPYWIEPGTCNSQNTVIWVKVPSIPASGQTTIRLWYGNSSATSLSSGDAVFEFFDDFEGTSLDTNKWTPNYANTVYYEVTNGNLRITDATKSGSTYWITGNTSTGSQIKANFTILNNMVIEWKQKMETQSSASQMGQVGLALNKQDKTIEVYAPQADGWNSVIRYVIGGWTYIGTNNYGTLIDIQANTYYTHRIIKESNSYTIEVRDRYEAGVLYYSATSTATIDYLSISVGAYGAHAFSPMQIDYVLVRKYASTEPSVSVGEEQITLPDLTITSFTVPSQLAVQQPFNIGVVVKNVGKPAGSFKVGIYVDNSKIAEQTISALDTDEEVQLTFSITVNQPGNHVIKAAADIYNEVEEISEANNEASVLRYVAAPDLTIAKLEVSPQLNVIVGRSVVITATVANLGDASASSVRVLATVKLNNETQYSEERRVSLNPQQNMELTFPFVPMKNGTHVIEVIIDPDNRFIEHSENNNAATASIEVGGLPFRTPTPPPVGGKTFREIYEPLTLRTYNLPLEAMSLIAVLGISVVGYGFGVFRGTVNFFFLSVIYFIVSTFLGWSMFIATGLLAIATVLLVVTVAFIREE